MQFNLLFVITEINKFVVSTNSGNRMATPFLANTIIQSCGPNKNVGQTTEYVMTYPEPVVIQWQSSVTGA